MPAIPGVKIMPAIPLEVDIDSAPAMSTELEAQAFVSSALVNGAFMNKR